MSSVVDHQLVKYPLGNTGTNSQTKNPIRFSAKIHWFQGCFSFDYDHQPMVLLSKIKHCFADDAFKKSYEIHRGNMRYRHVFKSVRSVILAWNSPTINSSGFGWLSVPGGAFDTWGNDFVDYLVTFFTLISQAEYLRDFRCTQIHLAVDDHHKLITPALALEAVQQGNISRFQPENYHYHLSTWVSPDGQIHKGDTVTFGTPNSHRRVTIYDKFVESRGEIDAIRFEAKFSASSAHATYQYLDNVLFNREDFFNEIIRLAFGAIDFPNRSTGDANLVRCLRLKWWQDAIDYTGTIRLPVVRKKPLLESSIEWLSRQTETTFVILNEVFGRDAVFQLFNAMLVNGYSKLDDGHRALIDVSKANPFDLMDFYNLITKNEV